MRYLFTASLALWLPVAAGAADILQSETHKAALERRPVAMQGQQGGTLKAQQVYVTLTRRDGQPVGARDLEALVPFVETAACGGRKVLVSLIVGAFEGAGRYEVLCAGAE